MTRGKQWLPSRRTVLRGAGVALALPWLESLLPRAARAQAVQPPKRFLPVYLPNGAPELWKPQAAGAGSAWKLSSVLEPLSALKAKVTVISGLENGSVFNADGSGTVEPPHSRQPGAWLTCADADQVAQQLNVSEANGVSVDQLLAAHLPIGGATALPSLQVGLSTVLSSCDGKACSLSRSVSWRTPVEPLYKLVDPKQVFERLVGVVSPPPDQPGTLKRRAERRSVLDAVLESAAVVQPKLSKLDQEKMEQFLDSVRGVERRVQQVPELGLSCPLPSPPAFADFSEGQQYVQTTATYNKATHADLMNDLIVLAFQCDLTRVISYMLEDENSEFTYDHVPLRTFTAEGSTPAGAGVCGQYSGAQHGSTDEFATITWWNVGKVAALCQKLDALQESDGSTVLDNSVVFLGSSMHGSDHRCTDLPSLFVGGGGGRLKTDQHVALTSRPMRDFYFTLMNGVFDLGIADFGLNRTGAPLAQIAELINS